MTTDTKVLVPPAFVPATQTLVYTSPTGGLGTWIDHLESLNYSGTAATITVNVVALADTPGNQNLATKAQSIAAGASYGFPEIAGRFIGPGYFFSIVAGTATALNFTMSGRELT